MALNVSVAEIVDTLLTVAQLNGWQPYRLHAQRTDPARAAAPDAALVRDGELVVFKAQSEPNAKKNGLTDDQEAQLLALRDAGATVLWVTSAPAESAAKPTASGLAALSLSETLDVFQAPRSVGDG